MLYSTFLERMPRGSKLSEKEEGQIEAYHEIGHSNRWIATKLHRSHDVINKYLEKPAQYGTKKSTGRKPKLSKHQKREIVRKASNSMISGDKIKRELNLNVHRNTVLNVLKASPRIVRARMRSAPALTPADMQIRLDWARRNMKTDWNLVGIV